MNLLQLPLLCIQISLHGLAQKISAVTIEEVSQLVKRGDSVRRETKTHSLLLHIAKYYIVLWRNTASSDFFPAKHKIVLILTFLAPA